MLLTTKVAAVEMGEDEIRLAVFAVAGKKISLLEGFRAPVHAMDAPVAEEGEAVDASHDPQFDAKVAALVQCLDQMTQNPAAYVLCANVRYSVVRVLSIPFRGARRVAAAVPFELEPHLAFPLEELLVDYNTITEVDGETEVLAMGMRRSHLEKQLAVMLEAGIDADAVSLDAIGFSNLWLSQYSADASGLTACVHVRSDGAAITVMHDKTLAYVRYLPFNAQQLLDTPDAAARDIQNSLRAFLANWRSGGEISSLYITGVSLNAYELKALEESLRLPVSASVLLESVEGASAVADAHDVNLWESLAGSALGAAGKGQTLDFTRNEQDWQSSLRGILAHVMFSSCVALILLLGWAFYYYHATGRNEVAANEIRAKIEKLQEESLALSEQGLGDGLETAVFSDPKLLDILKEIAAKMPEDKASLVELRLSPPDLGSSWIRIQGESDSTEAYFSVYEDLKTSTLFTVEDNPDMKMRDNKTAFEIIAYHPDRQG